MNIEQRHNIIHHIRILPVRQLETSRIKVSQHNIYKLINYTSDKIN
jgi:hypothetical protein